MKKRISMKDIASQLGVSTALVSYVLNGKNTERINADTAARIKDLAASLNYFPNQIAKSLKSDRTFIIGLVIADISNLYYSNIARFIEDKSNRHNYNVVFGSADESASKFKDLVQILLSRQVDGLILAAPPGSEETIMYLKEQNIPFVLIDRFFPALEKVTSVVIDNYSASYQAVRLLAEHGNENPAMITITTPLTHMKERTRGFQEGVIEILGTPEPAVFELNETELSTQVEAVIRQVVASEQIDGLYFSTNKIAMAGLAVLAKLNISVPDTLSVLCFDEADAYKIFNTGITYVKQPLEEIAHEAVEILIQMINGEEETKNVVFETSICIGASIDKPGLKKAIKLPIIQKSSIQNDSI